MSVRYWYQSEIRERIDALTIELRTVLPEDIAWQRLCPKVAQAWVVWRITDYISGTGTSKTKGAQEKKVDAARWDVVRAIVMDWPGYPLGAGTGGPNEWMMLHDPGITTPAMRGR